MKRHIGLIGYGNIATDLIARLPDGTKTTILIRASLQAAPLPSAPAFVDSAERLILAAPDLVIECAGHSAVRDHIPALLAAGIDVIIASVGALADHDLLLELQAAAKKGGARIIIPSGAIGGRDILRTLASDGPVDVTYNGTKPPHAWKGSPADALIDLDTVTTPVVFYQGTGREAARAFPKNANVVAALAMAGGGFDRMKVTLTADPTATNNTHSYCVRSPICQYQMSITATPSSGNAKTSATTALSIMAEIDDYYSRSQRHSK